MTSVRSIRMSVIAAALLAGFAFNATAQAPAAPPATSSSKSTHAHAHARLDPAKWQERFERRMGELKQKLQIMPVQEGAWNAFISAMQPTARTPRPDREALAAMTTPERIDRMRALQQQRMAAMDQRAEATKALYAALTPEQQKTFDELTLRPLKRGAGHHRGGHHHRS